MLMDWPASWRRASSSREVRQTGVAIAHSVTGCERERGTFLGRMPLSLSRQRPKLRAGDGGLGADASFVASIPTPLFFRVRTNHPLHVMGVSLPGAGVVRPTLPRGVRTPRAWSAA